MTGVGAIYIVVVAPLWPYVADTVADPYNLEAWKLDAGRKMSLLTVKYRHCEVKLRSLFLAAIQDMLVLPNRLLDWVLLLFLSLITYYTKSEDIESLLT